LSVVNSGTASCDITAMFFPTSPSPFAVVGPLNLPETLPPTESVSVEISYTPFAGALLADTLVVTYTPPNPDVPSRSAAEPVDAG
jgi:hypothetical protein